MHSESSFSFLYENYTYDGFEQKNASLENKILYQNYCDLSC